MGRILGGAMLKVLRHPDFNLKTEQTNQRYWVFETSTHNYRYNVVILHAQNLETVCKPLSGHKTPSFASSEVYKRFPTAPFWTL
jgi:hypothetical protein